MRAPTLQDEELGQSVNFKAALNCAQGIKQDATNELPGSNAPSLQLKYHCDQKILLVDDDPINLIAISFNLG